MNRLPFPKRLTINLLDFQRRALSRIADLEGIEDEAALVGQVLSRGIVALLANEAEGGGIAAPPDAVAKRMQVLRDLLQAKPEVDAPRRRVERYIACPIDEELRRGLGDFLTRNPDLDEEGAFALLLERGLRKTENDREGAQSKTTKGSMRPFPKPGPIDDRSVADTVTLMLDDDLRDRLEEFIITRPGDLESAITSLVGVGLDAVKEDPGVLDPARVIEELKSDESPTKVGARQRRHSRALQLRAMLRRGG